MLNNKGSFIIQKITMRFKVRFRLYFYQQHQGYNFTTSIHDNRVLLTQALARSQTVVSMAILSAHG